LGFINPGLTLDLKAIQSDFELDVEWCHKWDKDLTSTNGHFASRNGDI